jgi:hypothetical protein
MYQHAIKIWAINMSSGNKILRVLNTGMNQYSEPQAKTMTFDVTEK